MPNSKPISAALRTPDGPQHWPVFAAGLIVIVGAILFSTKAIFVKLSLPYGIDPIALLTWRMLIALPLYICILAISLWRADETRVKAKQWIREFPNVLLLGFVGYYLASYFDFVGLTYIDAGLERVILYAYPTLVLLISAIWLGKPISLHQFIAIALCYLGIFVAVRFGLTSQQQPNLVAGSALVFLSALTYAIYLIGSGELIPRLGVWVFTSTAMIVSAACVLTHQWIAGSGQLFGHPPVVYGYAAAMAIFATVAPSFLISAGIKRIGANNAAIFGGVGPISTIVLASIFLGEKLTVAQWVGTALVISGVIYISLNIDAKETNQGRWPPNESKT